MRHAIHFSETGHLCLSTLHSNNANGALDRIINFFPESAREQLLLDLSNNLRAIVSQRLVPGVDGKRVPAVEILLNTPYVADLIQKGKLEQVKDAMTQSSNLGMQTFDQALFILFKEGMISEEEAIKNADSKNNVALQIRLSRGSDASAGDLEDLTISDDDDVATFSL
jgi:twitching motility protein PilU